MKNFTKIKKLAVILALSGMLAACGESVSQTANSGTVGTFSEANGEYKDVGSTNPAVLSALMGNYCGTLNRIAGNVTQSQSMTLNISTQNMTNAQGQSLTYAVMSLSSNGGIGNVSFSQPMGMTLDGYFGTYGFITDIVSNTTLRTNPFKVALEINLNSSNQVVPQNSSFVFRDCAYSSTVCLTDATDVTVSAFTKCN